MPEQPEANEWREDRYGYIRWITLPDERWKSSWERIYIPADTKERLRSYVEFSLRRRGEFSRIGLPVHGIALLYGPPGTGKSTLARGVAEVVAEDLLALGHAEETIFAEVDPHALPSQMLGESQRNTMDLLQKSLPELAAKGRPVIVAIDEVNTLATRRSMASGGRDPVDVMRATEAALRGIDYLAATTPNVVILATSNFVATIDEAMLDRVDIALELSLPDEETIRSILRDTVSELPESVIEDSDFDTVIEQLKGRSGRDIRKVVLEAVFTGAPAKGGPLTIGDIELAAGTRRNYV